MKLLLQNGYPYPFPEGFDVEAEGYDSREFQVILHQVVQFEWKYCLTIEFSDFTAASFAQAATGWKSWAPVILEATISVADGYDHPAIIVGDKAYCGFIVCEDDYT
jgi:hypothetical protein